MSRGRPRTRAARVAWWLVVGLLGTTLLAVVAAPLVVRGAILAHLVARASTDRCGTVEVEGGRVGLGLVPALLFQRPFPVTLDGLRIREPDGNDFVRAKTVRATLAVLRRPWRLVIDRISIADGSWQLVDKGLGEPITQALTKIPAGGRAQCGRPAPPAGAPPTPGSKLTVRAVELRNVSVRLSFRAWEVVLGAVDARGRVEVVRATSGEARILFDVRDVLAAKGGSLRVGPAGVTPVVPFDRVSIPRVAATRTAPQDLLLEVEAARTASAVLSGRATFTNVFAPRTRHAPAGMDLEARWTAVGQALARTPPPAWAALGERLASVHAGLHASLHGPFEALTGAVTVAGRGMSASAQLLPPRRYALDLRFHDFDIAPLLPRGQRARLGGRLDGRLSASARLAKRPAETTASLDTVELSLARGRAGDADGLPRRWVMSRTVRARPPGELRVTLGAVALAAEVLRVDPIRVEAPGVSWAGSLRAEPAQRSRAFLVRLRSRPGSRITAWGETFSPPALLAARIDPGRAVRVAPFSVRRDGGGAIDAGGTIGFSGALDLSLAIRAYPLARLPTVAGIHAPGHRAPVGDVLRGRLDVDFHVGGNAHEPSLSGTLALSDVAWARQRLGGGRVAFEGIRDGTRFAGRLLDGIDVRGTLRRRARAEDLVAVTLRDLQLGPWLPRAVAALPVRASGEITWRRGARASPRITAELALRAPGIVLDAHGRLEADKLGADTLEASLRGTLDGRALGPWLPGQGSGSGTATLSARATGPLGAPRASGRLQFQAFTVVWAHSPFGTVRVDGPLVLDDRTLTVGPLVARFQSGGWVAVTGPAGTGSGRVVLAAGGAPLPVSDVQLTVLAAGLKTVRPISGLSLGGLGMNVRVTETDRTTLRLVGDVQLGRNLFQFVKRGEKTHGKKGATGAKPARPPGFADHVWLHLRVIGPDRAVTVDVPRIPDVTIDAGCLIQGPLTAPVITGRVKGHNLYSRAALAIGDWFTERNLRGCDLAPRPQPR